MENGSSNSTNESGFAPMDSANNHETMDIAVGCAFSITSLLCLVVYWIILKVRENSRIIKIVLAFCR
jgi:hypothetical protein